MGLYYKDSVMAKADAKSETLKDYYDDEVIYSVSIEQVLMALVHNNYGFKGKPTKEELKEALKEIKEFELETFNSDFDFYAENVIGKFLTYKKE